MRIAIYLLALTCFFCLNGNLLAQDEDDGKPKVYQLSGMVLNKSNFEPIPYATVRIIHTRRGIIANNEGFFSIPVVEEDTLIFMSLGHRPSILIMKNYLENYLGDKKSPYVYAINYLQEDTIHLQGVTIFPYDTPEKLKTALLAMGSQKTLEEKYAEDNLDPELLDDFISNMELDNDERYIVGRQIYYQQYQQKSMMPVMPLFDPVAVYRLLKYITDKAKEKREKDLNYWED
ncbi:MAG: hypothetical protein H6581_08790 [Bacteroidia bacterium]|nr:hypothetical protein [Bacteroidia bacterium]